jgi:hypothetical protein
MNGDLRTSRCNSASMALPADGVKALVRDCMSSTKIRICKQRARV